MPWPFPGSFLKFQYWLPHDTVPRDGGWQFSEPPNGIPNFWMRGQWFLKIVLTLAPFSTLCLEVVNIKGLGSFCCCLGQFENQLRSALSKRWYSGNFSPSWTLHSWGSYYLSWAVKNSLRFLVSNIGIQCQAVCSAFCISLGGLAWKPVGW